MHNVSILANFVISMIPSVVPGKKSVDNPLKYTSIPVLILDDRLFSLFVHPVESVSLESHRHCEYALAGSGKELVFNVLKTPLPADIGYMKVPNW
jgi:hypothetical protein